MRKILAYSGGYDSTVALVELMANAKSGDEIIAISMIHHSTGDAKLRREQESRIIIIDKLRRRYPEVNLKSMEIEVSMPWDIGSAHNSTGLSQPIFWICNIIPLIEDGDEVNLGYIRDDQAITHISDMHKMWNSAMRIQANKKVTLKFPNRYAGKTEILVHLMNNYPELIDYCISYESSGYDARKVCGHCEPCKHMKQALLSLMATESGSVRDKCKSMLEDMYNLKVSIGDEDTALKSDCTEVEVITIDEKG